MNRCAVLLALFSASTAVVAGDWPAWRGPTGQGFSDEKNVPVTWSASANVKWKIPLEVQGNSTPVTFGDKIFLTQANTGGSLRELLCLSRADGKELWRKKVEYKQPERNWNKNWYANASPSVEKGLVFVSFGSAGLYCYDHSGTELWKKTDLGHWDHSFGNASSPVIYKDLVILWCGPNDNKGKESYNVLRAFDKRTGNQIWEHTEKVGSWSTPIVADVQGKDQLLLSVVPHLRGFDPASGKLLWSCEGLTKYVYTSPLYGNGVAIGMSGYGGAALGVKLGGTGDITADRLWHHPNNTQRVGSGMIIGDHAYMIEENGNPHCYDLKTGKEVWQVKERAAGTTWGSMVHADGRLYVMMRNCDTIVLAAKPKYEVLATNPLGKEETNSSPVISNGEILLRTFKNLYCIAEKK